MRQSFPQYYQTPPGVGRYVYGPGGGYVTPPQPSYYSGDVNPRMKKMYGLGEGEPFVWTTGTVALVGLGGALAGFLACYLFKK